MHVSVYKYSVDCCQQLKNSFLEEVFFFKGVSLLPVFVLGYNHKCFILVCALCQYQCCCKALLNLRFYINNVVTIFFCIVLSEFYPQIRLQLVIVFIIY